MTEIEAAAAVSRHWPVDGGKGQGGGESQLWTATGAEREQAMKLLSENKDDETEMRVL